MSRVGKVLIGARSVFANGGCVTAAGVATVCECAKEHRTPVFTVAGLYKLSPTYPFDRDNLIEVGNSGKVIPYEDNDLMGKCEVSNPLYDYVIPEHIDIYITNIKLYNMSQMQIDTDHIDRSIDDSKVIIEFSNILKNFKENPIDFDVFELINSFKKTTLKKLLEIEQQSYSSNNINNNSNDDLLNDWILESKFWNLIEILIRFKYSNEYNDNDTNNNNTELVNLSNDISQFNSNLIIKEKILINDSKLREIWLVISWLIDNFKLDLHSEADDITMNDLSVNKWLNTKIDLTNNKPNIIKNLNYDSIFDKNNTTFSNNNISIKNNLNIKDKENDSKFFQKAFFLLLEKDFNKLNELCELTNNWNFQLMLNGCQDFIDPKIDGSELFNSEKGTEELSTIGIKHQSLWRRTIYNLSQQKNTNNEELNYEKGCYSYLCGDLNSNIINLTNSWEKKLLIILNNLFQSLIEEKLINYLKISNKIDNYELNSILKNPKPLKSVNSINECFQILNGDNNQLIISQNQHPIRVLIGSIITNNLPKLMENLISMINNLTENDDLPENNNNVLTNEAYILRILIHLLIFMKLLDNDIISDKFFIKLIKTYILRLSLYKLYDQIPIYISLIPNENDIIEIYSFIISKFLINNNNEDKEFKVIKLNQLKLMKELNLPLEKILRNLNNYSFQITESYYSSFEIVEINLNKFNLNVESNYDLNDFEIDSRLINSISWFIESNMITDSLNSIIIAFRRFLLIGHIESKIIQILNQFISKQINS
ncbi:unnamed protein product [[Candida] boidinii]|nr:unnamed protein product [[Candida] boidinii]